LIDGAAGDKSTICRPPAMRVLRETQVDLEVRVELSEARFQLDDSLLEVDDL